MLSTLRYTMLISGLFLICSAQLIHAASEPDVTITAHAGPVLDIAFSPDGLRLASAGDDGKLKLWDMAAKKEIFTFDGIRSSTNSLRFSPDGKILLALNSDNTIAVIDTSTGKLARSIPLPDMIGGPAALDLSPDGKTIAVVGRSKLRLIDLTAGTTKAEYAVHAGYGVTAVAFSADGALIATAGTDNMALIIDPAASKILHTIKLGLNGAAVILSRDGRTLYVATTDREIHAFELESGSDKKLFAKGMPIYTLALTKDGKTLIAGGPGRGPVLIPVAAGHPEAPEFNSNEASKSAAISPDSQWLASGGGQGSIFLWRNQK